MYHLRYYLLKVLGHQYLQTCEITTLFLEGNEHDSLRTMTEKVTENSLNMLNNLKGKVENYIGDKLGPNTK